MTYESQDSDHALPIWKRSQKHPWGNAYTVVAVIIFSVAFFCFYAQSKDQVGVTLQAGDLPETASYARQYQPPTQQTERAVLAAMAEFRARYKQVQPDVQVHTRQIGEGAKQVQQHLRRWLNSNQLQSGSRTRVPPQLDAADFGGAAVVLVHAPGQARYAAAFIQAVNPYLNAEVLRRSVSGLKSGALHLMMNGALHFHASGQVRVE